MYRVLLLDDEELIVTGLADYIQKKCNRYELLLCYTGEQALDVLRRYHIHIVVTDIEMLGIDGLELHACIRQDYPFIYTVFLTAHSNFEYAYVATKNEKTKFLLKADGYNQVIHTLDHIVSEIESNIVDRMMRQQVQNVQMQSVQMNRYLFINHCLRHPLMSNERVQRGLLSCGMALDATRPLMMVLVHLHIPSSFGERSATLSTATALLQSNLEQHYVNAVIPLSEEEIICLLHVSEENRPRATTLQEQFEMYQEALNRLCACNSLIALTDATLYWKDCMLRIESLRIILAEYASDESVLIRLQKTDDKHDSAIKWAAKLAEAMGENDTENLQHIFDEMNGVLPVNEIQSVILHFLEYNTTHRSRILHTLLDYYSTQMKEGYTQETLRNLLNNEKEREKEERNSHKRVIVERINAYIDTHYHESLFLSDIAEHLYMSPTYISKLYKSYCGTNIVDRIMEVRLTKGLDLVLNTNKKIKEIASDVGFNSARYFNLCFKKKFGLAPNVKRDEHWNTTD